MITISTFKLFLIIGITAGGFGMIGYQIADYKRQMFREHICALFTAFKRRLELGYTTEVPRSMVNYITEEAEKYLIEAGDKHWPYVNVGEVHTVSKG